MTKIPISLTFLEPFRLVDWVSESERDKSEFLRGLSFARWHRIKNQREDENQGRPYITGTLLRSAVIKAAEELIFLNGGKWQSEECCNGQFKGSKAKYRKVECPRRRHRATLKWTDNTCSDYHNACPFCLLLGCLKPNSKENSDIHFSNLSLPNKQIFKNPPEIGIRRILNRVDFTTGKAQDYFYVWEVEHSMCPKFQGTVKINEDMPKYNVVKDLLISSIQFVDKLCGALCVIEIGKTKNYICQSFSSNIPEEEIKKLAQEIRDILKGEDALDKMRVLADTVLQMRTKGPEIVNELPRGIEKKGGHWLWDKLRLRKKFKEIANNYKDSWQELCEKLGNELYISYKELTGGIAVKKRIIGETEYRKIPEQEISFLPSKAGYSYEWIILGKLISENPFFFGKETKTEEQIDMQILLTKDGRYRLPRSVLRGALRRDLRLVIGSGCDVELGSKRPCPCPVCRIMRRVTLKDARSDYCKPPEVRKRIRINPLTGTVQKGALFTMEVAPEGISFPFQLRFRGEDKFHDALQNVLVWWKEGKLFLGGGASTGKGRFKLEIEHVLKWDLKNNFHSYLQYKGLRDKGDFNSIKEIEGLKVETEEFKVKKPFPWSCVEYTIFIESPFVSGDPVEAVLDSSNTDLVTFKKYKLEESKEVFAIKGESIRGVFRTAVGKNEGKLTTENEHEDCTCILCRLFGNEHETGKVRFEDLELINDSAPKRLDHVAIDRFTGGAKEQAKFDDSPLIGSPDSPLEFTGIVWVRDDIDEEEKKALKSAFLDIKSGYYPLGGKKGVGYGWVSNLKIESGPEWLRLEVQEKSSQENVLSPVILSEVMDIEFNPPKIDENGVYFPYAFLRPLNEVKRTREPIGHNEWKKSLISGYLTCRLELLTPLIIPDTSEEVIKEKVNNGEHPVYKFFRLGGHLCIPAAEIRGMISSVYEALTNSCFRVFDEKRLISWRMTAEEAKRPDPKKSEEQNRMRFRPGRIIKKDKKFYAQEMLELRIPVYDNKDKRNEISQNDPTRPSEYNHPTEPERIFFSNAEKIRNFLKRNSNYLHGSTPLLFRQWSISNRYDKIALIGNKSQGHLKFTGPNKIEVSEGTKCPKYETIPGRDEWDKAVHNYVEPGKFVTVISRKKGQKPKAVQRRRNVPAFCCYDYNTNRCFVMNKRCERVFKVSRDKPKYEIPPDAIRRYEHVLRKYRENWERYDIPEVFRTRLPGDGETLNEGDLVYFRLDENNRVLDIIPVSISRISDTQYLGRRLPDHLRSCVRECLYEGWGDCKPCKLSLFPEKMWIRINPEGLCPACHLFGTQVYKGRVRFGFARAGSNWKFREEQLTLPRFETPRPTWVIPKRKDEYQIPGRKFYLHHNGWEEIYKKNKKNEIKKEKNNATFEVLKQGTFYFKVFFENLELWELGLLIFSAELGGEEFAHKLGHGKALGFGSVKISVDKIILRRDPGQFEQRGQKFKRDAVDKGFCVLENRFGKTNFKIYLNNFLQLLYWPNNKKVKVRYPYLRQEDDPEKLPGYVELKKHQMLKDDNRYSLFARPRAVWLKWTEMVQRDKS